MKGKNVLMVSYYFPPSGGSGVLRIVRFVVNISRYGWQPFVITTDSRDLDKIAYGTISRDESFAGIEKNVALLRVRSCRPSYLLSMLGKAVKRAFVAVATRFSRIMKGWPRRHAEPDSPPMNAGSRMRTASSESPRENTRVRGFRSMGKSLLDSLFIVDQLVEWTVPAVWKGVPFARRNGISCVFSSSPPWSAHLIALFLKRLCRRKWVMDLRDPIYRIAGDTRGNDRSIPIEFFHRSLERFLIRNADVVVCNCEEIREYYQRRYGKKRFAVIMNSFDESEFARGIARKGGNERITIRHIGELYETIRTPDPFLRATAELLREEPRLRERLSIAFVGDKRYVHLPVFKDLCAALDLQRIVQTEGYVPHREAIVKMLESDVLLLLQPHESTRYQIPAKLFEYVATGNPILALAPAGSATFNLIKRHNLGIVNDPSDTEGIKRGIREAIAGNVPRPSREAIEEFSAARMAKKLVDILESLQ